MVNQYPWKENTTPNAASQGDPRYETPGGAQAKADQAEQNAKDYTDAKLALPELPIPNGSIVERHLRSESVTTRTLAQNAVTLPKVDERVLDAANHKYSGAINASTVKGALDKVEDDLQYFIQNSGNSVAEIVQARVPASGIPFDTLKKRLDDSDAQLADIAKLVIIDVTKYGAVAGASNCTEACIDAFAFAASIEDIPKVIVFPYSHLPYMIDGTSQDELESGYGKLRIPSNTTIDLCGSTLKIIPNNRTNSSIFRADEKINIIVKNGSIFGDYVFPVTKSGEWQFGVAFRSCKNVIVENIKTYNMRGDGIYFGYVTADNKNENIIIDGCYIDTSDRNGISITSGKNITIKNTTVNYTTGRILGAGIDFEPDGDVEAEYIENAIVENCIFNNIKGAGAAIRFQFSKNCKAINNTVMDSDIGAEARQSYNIEYVENRFMNIRGILLNGNANGNILFKENVVSFNVGALSGFNAFHFNIWGTSTEVRVMKNEFLSAVAPLFYIVSPLTYLMENNFNKCDPNDIGFEYVRTRNSAVVFFTKNTVVYNDGHSVSADIRVRDTSKCNVKNNTTINGSLSLVKSESGMFTTDVYHSIPTFGSYRRGDVVKNSTPSAGGFSRWICITTGEPGVFKGDGSIQA